MSVLFAGDGWKDDIVPFVPHAVVAVNRAAGEGLLFLKTAVSDLNFRASLAKQISCGRERQNKFGDRVGGGGWVTDETLWTKIHNGNLYNCS